MAKQTCGYRTFLVTTPGILTGYFKTFKRLVVSVGTHDFTPPEI